MPGTITVPQFERSASRLYDSGRYIKWLSISMLLAISGCSRPPPPAQPAVPIPIAELESPYSGKFIQCDESVAERVLDVFVTVDGEFERWPFEIPIRKASATEWPEGGGFFCAAGSGGGFTGSIRVEPGRGDAVPLHVSLQYSSSGRRGTVDQVIETTIGHDGTTTVNEVWRIDWSWRAPSPAGAEQ